MTNYHSHEQSGALANLCSIGVRVRADVVNPFRSTIRGKSHDMLNMDHMANAVDDIAHSV